MKSISSQLEKSELTSLTESILDQEEHIEKAEKKAKGLISFKKLISDIESMIKQYGYGLYKGGMGKINNIKEPTYAFKIDSELYTETYSGPVTVYRLCHDWKNTFAEKYGYGNSNIRFCIDLQVWNDTSLGRPRYKFNDFRISIPTTRSGGYAMEWYETFGAKKVTPEHYELAKQHIEGIIKDFTYGFKYMDALFEKTRRNIQRSDFNKIKKLIFGDKIKSEK